MPMIITSKSGKRVCAYDMDQNGCSVRWNDEAHEETNHAAALRRLAGKLNYAGMHWNGARKGTDRIIWIAASGQRFTATT